MQAISVDARARRAALAVIWLLALALLAIGIVLLPRIIETAQHSWDTLTFPWQIELDEGLNVNASWLLSQNNNIYGPNTPDHFVSAPHMPLFYALNAAAIKVWGLSLLSGRLLSLLGAVAVALLLWALVYAETKRHTPGILVALLFITLGPVSAAATLYKPDLLATALALVGVWILVSRFSLSHSIEKARSENPGGAYWSILPFALALWTWEGVLPIVLAAALYLLLRDRQTGVRWLVGMALAVIVPFLIVDLYAGGGFHQHLLAFMSFDRSITYLANNLFLFWRYNMPLFVCGLVYLFLTMRQTISRREAPPLSSLYLLLVLIFTPTANTLPTAGNNQMLDLLPPLCLALGISLGTAWRELQEGALRPTVQRAWGDWAALVAVTLVLAALQTLMLYNHPANIWYWPDARSLQDRAPVMASLSSLVAQTQGEILSDDAWLLLKNGRRVLYDDRAAMSALARKGAWDESVLLQDLNTRRFSMLLLQRDPEDYIFNLRWTPEALDAFKANYRGPTGDLFSIYTPR